MDDVIIIGAGMAGLTAALNCLRNGRSVRLFEGEAVGGQIANSPKVENFPTIKEISGLELADKAFEQVTERGAEIEYDKVTSINKVDDEFVVKTDYDEFKAHSVIAAVGVKHKHIGVVGENELLGRGVYYCALCDGHFYKDKEVALIGDGNTAMQYALLLCNICSKVYVLTWSDKFFGDKELENRLRARENAVIMPFTSVTGFIGEGALTAVEYKCLKTDEIKTLNVPAVFVAIGQVPDNSLFSSLAELDEKGYFSYSQAVGNSNGDLDVFTKTEGLFVAGDCRAKGMRQLATAMSDGALAAFYACNYLDKKGF